ncbi:protein phosphatase CheZ [Ideonella sp. 4Y11]|uniref:Protein phosphatase CheZ n=1 Tax=Ideonella aquatica TaxID=2824119 RepID=A0A940YLD1_9BURK|nr:protein phosphatase CheZ [Ideonella aquatica]MBQ0958426.1 protein phosphatase CheZ [Ideonella aquatica]
MLPDPSLHAATGTWVKPELRQAVREVPDACERLEYVGKMTEQAATRVLALIDEAKPACDEVRRRGLEIAEAMRRLAESPEIDTARSRVMMKLCADYAASAAAFADDQNRVLTDVMLAQDFQDLSGQVIGKVMKILFRVEDELKHVLADGDLPDPVSAMSGATEELAGVQVPDRALQQDDVDDLLASLGF